MLCPSKVVFLLVSLAFSAGALEWQDCALQADIPSLHVTAYSHTPDPEVLTENHTITKSYMFNGNSKLTNLTETVFIDKAPVHPLDPSFVSWTPYFNNSFDLCEKNEWLCPVAVNSSFTLSDTHPPSTTSKTGSWYRAVEYYHSGNVSIGCASTIYQVVD